MTQPARIAIAGTLIVARLAGVGLLVLALGEVIHWTAIWWESRRGHVAD